MPLAPQVEKSATVRWWRMPWRRIASLSAWRSALATRALAGAEKPARTMPRVHATSHSAAALRAALLRSAALSGALRDERGQRSAASAAMTLLTRASQRGGRASARCGAARGAGGSVGNAVAPCADSNGSGVIGGRNLPVGVTGAGLLIDGDPALIGFLNVNI